MLRIENINFSYKPGESVLNDISFEVRQNEKICILGESGSGKSTLLKIIYAELQADSGKIYFNQSEIKGRNYQLVPGHEEIKYVPQDFALDPYISVKEIVGKFLSNINPERKKKRIKEVLEALGISDLADRKAEDLSGGQKQRVAIARAVAKIPKLLLLDEPFGQLDAALHVQIREQLFTFLEKHKIAVMFTSHRADDALGYSDKIVLLKDGKTIQQDTPSTVYHTPANTYVAGLFGQVNILGPDVAQKLQISRNYMKDVVVIYPEEISIKEEGSFTGLIKKNRFQGKYFEIELIFKGKKLKAYHSTRILPDSKVNFEILNYRWVKK